MGMTKFDGKLEGDPPGSDAVALTDEQKAYYQQRAEEEIALAQAAEHEGAVHSHYLLAAYYLDLVHHEQPIDES
jgi:hypothetical protein